MITQGRFDEITGSISVGKEANVFRAEKHTPTGTEYYALKVGQVLSVFFFFLNPW